MTLSLTQKRIKRLLDDGTVITGQMIKELIEDHAFTKTRTHTLYERYRTTKVPIFNRTFDGANAGKINNLINNDFFSEVIDVKQGYLTGKPIVYSLDKNKYDMKKEQESTIKKVLNKLKKTVLKSEDEYEKHNDFLTRLTIRNNFPDLDAELVKLVSICGHAGREIHVDDEGEVRVANLNPWETIFLTNQYGEVVYAVRYYLDTNDKEEKVMKAEFFDASGVTYFEESEGDYDKTGEQEHLFGLCPIIKVINNEEEMGDVERVLALIDGYDRTLSDINSEIEQFRLAYMYFKGKEPTAEVIESAKQTGGFFVGQDGEVGFITKNINDQVVENHLNRLEDNILRFAKSVHFGDAVFGNDISGVAMKFKLFALESKSVVLEMKMQAALRNQFKIIANLGNLQNVGMDYLDVFFEFKRNLPINMQDEVQANAAMMGLVSERTRLAQLPFVDDVEYEIEQMKEDKAVEIDSAYSDIETDTETDTKTNTDIDSKQQ